MKQIRNPLEPPGIASQFVGRDAELDRIFALLTGPSRLITLTGPAGIGKTQLAAEVARRYQRARRVPTCWVRLASLPRDCERDTIEDAIAHAVAGMDCSERSSWTVIVDMLAQADASSRLSPTLLVLDNCEHVLDATTAVIVDLLDTVPGLSVLATSREATGWVDEHLVTVPPLLQRDASTLFRQRAEVAGSPLTDADQIATAHRICRHLHNNPLFIRLAAARLQRRPIAAVLQELTGEIRGDKRIRWSFGARVGVENRHRGIGDAIEWSYDLCPDDERLLFERMSVFSAGHAVNPADIDAAAVDVGVDLEAIQAVCADDSRHSGSQAPARLPSERIEDLIDRLADRSLVSRHITRSTVRYSLLESLHLFARQRLYQRSPDELSTLSRRHIRYYRDKVVQAAKDWFGPREQDFMGWVGTSWDNVRTALRRSISTPSEISLGLELCIGLLALPVPFNGSLREVRVWTERTIAAAQPDPELTNLRMTATALLVLVALRQGARDDAERMLDESVASSGIDPSYQKNWRDTVDIDIGLPAAVELAWGLELWLTRHDPRAVRVLTRARAKSQADGHRSFAAYCEMSAAGAAAMLGTENADELIQCFLDHANAARSGWATAWAEIIRAVTLIGKGEASQALERIHDALNYHVSVGDQWGCMWALLIRVQALGQQLAHTGGTKHKALIARATEIGYLVGGLATLRARFGSNIQTPPEFTARTTEAVARANQVLGADAFAAAQRRGSRLRAEHNEVQRLALGKFEMPDDRAHPSMARPDNRSTWSTLTRSEQHVAELAAAGWTNPAIAERRGTSVRTVDAQIAAILSKLAVTSRRDIAELVPPHRIASVQEEAERWARRHADKSPDGL
ncbi:ATP-binding protein [Nocardia gipuzkoensis]|uniref:ATP-binding protein n=1 Tax=Nocardia gipuzkoensis TaxID=2749991 RepID=UPI003EE02F5E